MPGWTQVLNELRAAGSSHDLIRRQHLKALHEYTGRNVICYYSAWLEKGNLAKQGVTGFEVNDTDKNAFMATIHELDRSLGLDLILHTPGGDAAATESLVEYLREMFEGDLRVIVPHLAMSAGTMIALASREIVMGRHSSLGPIDPQINGVPAHGIVEEFEKAKADISSNPATIPLWQPIIAKYHPTLIGECEKAIAWSEEMVRSWLITGMFQGEDDAQNKANRIITELGDHALNKSHARHIGAEKARLFGLKVTSLESDQALQEAVLTVHHTFVQTASESGAIKIVENHLGVAHISAVQVQLSASPAGNAGASAFAAPPW